MKVLIGIKRLNMPFLSLRGENGGKEERGPIQPGTLCRWTVLFRGGALLCHPALLSYNW